MIGGAYLFSLVFSLHLLPRQCESVCAEELRVEMQRGDVLVVDTNLWYHGTKTKAGVVTISIGSEYD